MLFENNREALRKGYIDAWHKHLNKLPVSPLEAEIIEVVSLHPEYHTLLTSTDISNKDYLPEAGETNPFLHMGLHLGLREQLQTNRPAGIQIIYKNLQQKLENQHTVEHQMMECLAQCLWEAQRNQSAPNEELYLEKLQHLLQ